MTKITTLSHRDALYYTQSMSIFVKSTPAPNLKTKQTAIVSYLLAAVLLLLVVGQIVKYESFVGLLSGYMLPVSVVTVGVLAGFIVFVELLAVPFLVRLRLSPAMRLVSMACGWLAIGIWLVLEIWLNFHAAPSPVGTKNTALFGASILPVAGWWSVLFLAALAVLAAWTAWGMWPFPLRRK